MKISKNLLLLSLAAVAFLLAGTAAKADQLSITLDSPFQNTGTLGGTLTFTATVTNTDPTNTIYLNSESFNLDAPLTLDASGFWTNSPLSLGPLASSGDFELFTVDVPFGAPVGLYAGTFEILGGDPSDVTNVIGSVNFNVNVVPEPSSLSLAGIGIVGLIGTLRRKISLRG
jgi:hypothetical protein